MSENYEIEKREFFRTGMDFPVEYRFLDVGAPEQYPEIYQGKTENLSGGGLLLIGKIPHKSWVPDLLMGKILVGVKINLEDSTSLKALAKMAWLERQDDDSCLIGLRFREISQRAQDTLIELVLDRHLP